MKATEPLLKISRSASTGRASSVIIGRIGRTVLSFLVFLRENIDHDGNGADGGVGGFRYTLNSDGDIHLSLSKTEKKAFKV